MANNNEKKLNGTVIVTYRCNARCSMCNRYKAPSKPEEEISIGELLDDIKSEANCLGISDRIIFYGASSEMEKMYMAMDVFVMPSLHEGLPVTGIEAQASGLPCVFADTITREVDITSTSKFLSLNMDAAIWAKNIMECKGKERVDSLKLLKQEGYDIEDTAHMVENFYLKIQN